MTLITALQFLFILHIAIPLRTVLVVDRFRALDIYGGVVVVQTVADALFYRFVVGVDGIVAMREAVDGTECQQRIEDEGCTLEIVQDGVFHDQSVGIVEEQQLFGEVEFAHPVEI